MTPGVDPYIVRMLSQWGGGGGGNTEVCVCLLSASQVPKLRERSVSQFGSQLKKDSK